MEDFFINYKLSMQLYSKVKRGEKRMEKKATCGIMLTLLFVGMLTFAFNIRQARAQTIRVPADYPTIQAAIDAASPGDTIFVSSGTYSGNVMIKKALTLIGESVETTIINGATRVEANNVTISRFTFQGYDGAAICLWDSSYNVISENKILGDFVNDIELWYFSSNNAIIGNNITGHRYDGIYLNIGGYLPNGTYWKPLSNNLIKNNLIAGHYNNGIRADFSDAISILENVIVNNRYGITFGASDNIVIEANTIRDNGDTGIDAGYSKNARIVGNDIIRSSWGILMADLDDSVVSFNNFTSSEYIGMQIWDSSNNTITNNNITQSGEYGIELGWSDLNKFYHNNFVDNINQISIYRPSSNTWDDGYPSGGNFWSDYTGADEYSGPDQSVPGNDGVGDTPYIIDTNNVDHYPLMKTWSPPTPPPQGLPPSAPQNLRAESRFSAVYLVWDAPTDPGNSPIQEYKIYRWTSAGEETIFSVDGNTLTYLDTSVSAENLYYYKVKAVNSAGEGPASNEVKCSSRQSLKGIETVVKLNEFKTVGDTDFSIQQNFWIRGDQQILWVQNIILVRPSKNQMAGTFEIYDYLHPDLLGCPSKLVDGRLEISPWSPSKDTMVLYSTIEDGTLIMENEFNRWFEWKLSSNSYIDTMEGINSQAEITIVGSYSWIPWAPSTVSFESPTNGYVDTYLRIGSSSGTWLYGENTVIRPPKHASTAETSTGLQWDVNGDFIYFPSWSDQGLVVEPDYKMPTASPPAPPIPVPAPSRRIIVNLGSPANLSLQDSLGRHVGYNSATGGIDEEIPNSLFLLAGGSQSIVMLDPLDTYALHVIGTGGGTYTLEIIWRNETGAISTIWESTGTITKDATFAYTISATPTTAPVFKPDPVAELKQLKTLIDSLPRSVFNEKIMSASKMEKVLSSKIDEIIMKVEAGNYSQAIDKLRYDIRAKMDGDSTATDWIIDPTTQYKLCIIIDHIIESIKILQENS